MLTLWLSEGFGVLIERDILWKGNVLKFSEGPFRLIFFLEREKSTCWAISTF